MLALWRSGRQNVSERSVERDENQERRNASDLLRRENHEPGRRILIAPSDPPMLARFDFAFPFVDQFVFAVKFRGQSHRSQIRDFNFRFRAQANFVRHVLRQRRDRIRHFKVVLPFAHLTKRRDHLRIGRLERRILWLFFVRAPNQGHLHLHVARQRVDGSTKRGERANEKNLESRECGHKGFWDAERFTRNLPHQ